MMLNIQVTLLLQLASCTSSKVPTTVKTVQQGATVTEPVLKASTLDKDDQLMTYHRGELCAQYFCNDWKCHNHRKLVNQFQVYSGDLCLTIPNVNVSNSGQYNVVLNGYKDVLNLILHVEEIPQHSISPPVIPVSVVQLVVISLVICSIY